MANVSINPTEDTEFNDALRKHGILPPKTPPPRTPSPPPSPSLEDILDDISPNDMRELAEDTLDDDTARVIDSYRRQRLAEIRATQRRARFGEVIPISREDYKREVTEASEIDEPGYENMKDQGTGVVCFLYKDGHIPSERCFVHIRSLASRHPRTKFTSIVGDKCIPDYPDRHLPTLFMYRRGQITNQQIAWGSEKERSMEELEALLMLSGVVIPERPLNENKGRAAEEDEDEDSRQPTKSRNNAESRSTGIRGPSRPTVEDDDSDFDL